MCVQDQSHWGEGCPCKLTPVVVVVTAFYRPVPGDCEEPKSGRGDPLRMLGSPLPSSGQCVRTDQSDDSYHQYTTDKDIERITSNWEELNMCCYYYGGLSSPQAKLLLHHSKVGTFLIRDSSDPKYLYSLSLKTERGTTSVRIEYSHGTFRLDCEDRLRSKMPRFMTVMQLIDHYVKLSQSEASKQCRWLESSGRRDVPVKLTRPRMLSPPSLQHLCRVTVNTVVPSVGKLHELPLPNSLKRYLSEYPYRH
ncbi:suppressor of cytokine signaling 2-like [Liolophura sinensis]|uniref:suppressor of cytokine signaling 2-like n=1 Tax=Liolophura sinensis TaxID=3198878 RepID=UPI003159840D